MTQRPLLSALLAALTFFTTVTVSLATNEHLQVSLFNKQIDTMRATVYPTLLRIEPQGSGKNEIALLAEHELEDQMVIGKDGEWSFCDYVMPLEAAPAVELVSQSISENRVAGEAFTVDMTFKNTGNTRLFSEESDCSAFPYVSMATVKPEARNSVFGEGRAAVSGWSNPGRIEMATDYADPGEEFHFTFESIAPSYYENNIYREFFQILQDGNNSEVKWLGPVFAYDIEIGTPTETMRDNMKYVSELSVAASQLEGLERNLEVNLTEQRMYIRFGELMVWTVPVSSGHWETPTPTGTYKIFQKSELRIGGKYPHYRMPYWQFWDARGYGIHGLPYLANDRGTFWQEAENHMGHPVSHGCIRTLDADAKKLYEFTIIGTPVWIHY